VNAALHDASRASYDISIHAPRGNNNPPHEFCAAENFFRLRPTENVGAVPNVSARAVRAYFRAIRTQARWNGMAEQKISRMALTAMVVGGMVGAGIFSLPRTFANATGPLGAVIAWLIAGTGMYMLARVFQALAERRPDIDAGVYAYAREGFGDGNTVVAILVASVGIWLFHLQDQGMATLEGGHAVQERLAALTTSVNARSGTAAPTWCARRRASFTPTTATRTPIPCCARKASKSSRSSAPNWAVDAAAVRGRRR
jgi:hypothetical protein